MTLNNDKKIQYKISWNQQHIQAYSTSADVAVTKHTKVSKSFVVHSMLCLTSICTKESKQANPTCPTLKNKQTCMSGTRHKESSMLF